MYSIPFTYDVTIVATGLLSEDQCKARDARRKARQKLLKVQQQQQSSTLPASMESVNQDSPHGSVNSIESKDGASPPTPGATEEGTLLTARRRPHLAPQRKVRY